MKLWHDDVRAAPDGWARAVTNADAKEFLTTRDVEEISLDHDLGATEEQIARLGYAAAGQGEETGYDLVRWMIDTGTVPKYVTIHSWNPIGAERMSQALADAGYACAIRPYVPE